MTLRFALLLLLPLVVAGCGSQNDTISIDLDDAASSGPAGIYEVTVFSTTPNTEEDWVLVLAPRPPGVESTDPARIVGYQPADPQRVMVGRYQRGSGQTLTGALRFYDVIEVEQPVLDEEGEEIEETETVQRRRVRTLSVDGNYEAGETLNLSFTGQNADGVANIGDGSIVGTYRQRLSRRISAENVLTGGWERRDNFGFPVVSFSIEPGPGRGIFGTALDTITEQQCRYDGRFNLIDQRFNVYDISFTQSGCGTGEAAPDREMLGLAFVDGIPVGGRPDEATELVFIMGSAPLPEDGSAEGRVFELRRPGL